MKCNGTYKFKRLKPQPCPKKWGCKWFDARHGKHPKASPTKPSSTHHKCSEFIDPIEWYKNQQT
jgi:hypothetical protein